METFTDNRTSPSGFSIPPPGKYWMRNKDVIGHTQWRIVWVRLAMTSDKRECVELGREDPWSDGYVNNILKPEEWVAIIPPNVQSGGTR